MKQTSKYTILALCMAGIMLTTAACSGEAASTDDSALTTTQAAVADGGEADEDEKTPDDDLPPDLPDGGAPSDGETPPDRPEGDTDFEGGTPPDGEAPPDKPDGDTGFGGGTPPDGNAPSGGTPPDKPGEGGMGGFGGSGNIEQGTSANTVDTDSEIADSDYFSKGDDENALRIDGATVALERITVDKSAGSSSNTEDGDFYGMNAAVLATNGATVTIKNSEIHSSAQNGNGIFSYGSGTTVTVSDTRIVTEADNSGGIQTTGGGTTVATDLEIETSGSSAAAIRSDRGGGTVTVTGGSYTTNGYNSPAVYSTADITVKGAALTANNSEALVIEGKNAIALEDCDVSGNMSDTHGTSSDENVHNIMIYQSMSGDADVGTSSFSATGGRIVSRNGDMIYVTNTRCTIRLSGVELVNEGGGYLLRVVGNSAKRGWGTAGANGGQATVVADGQTLAGDIVVDDVSTLDLTLAGNSAFTGTLNIVKNEQGGAAVADNLTVTIESGSVWTLTGDCTVTSVDNRGEIDFNGYTITLADGTVLK
ncbi:MAG: hypothetical protein NC084_07310 [Bacteroides sp.]|nr:hypothetical protein [Eubacterium sp.]MCM1418488.1 hypothetical protein [Roseburia sp.]MCM1462507.1 hypothetical protein [Bacteroides sp.]